MLVKLDPKENLEYFLLQIIAENISKKNLKTLLKKLPLHKQLALICFVQKNYREGSYTLLQQFEEIYTADHSIENNFQSDA